MWIHAAIGSGAGSLLAEYLGGFTIEVVFTSVLAGLIIFMILAYFTAPIRDG